jgi:hypothetical protein
MIPNVAKWNEESFRKAIYGKKKLMNSSGWILQRSYPESFVSFKLNILHIELQAHFALPFIFF